MCSRRLGLLAGTLLCAATWPSAAEANHIGITAGVGSSLSKFKPTSVLMTTTWAATCDGTTPEVSNWSGNLKLLRPDLGTEIYLGGVSSASGEVEQTVTRTNKPQTFGPVLTLSCYEDGTLHGSGGVTVSGAAVVVPPREPGGGGDGGGGGGGGGGGDNDDGGGGGGGGPDDPLHGGGCAGELRGTNAADVLEGDAGGDVILGLGGADRVRGRDGHDCLIGGSGGDRLLGEEGYDRLTGGSGSDRLDGGPGRNAYDAGSGDDTVKARNGRRETVRCGPGDDSARVDSNDRVRGCERVRAG
jgi:Ca2+-binding RTX toxin-like protein